ncbi:MAG: EVE domain-containing protein [Bacteroidia bacterium]
MNYWLMKTEPDCFSWDDMVRDKKATWDGVRNYAARNNMQAMKKGDLVFIYHSNIGKEIVGIAEVIKEAYPDPTTDDARWVVVDVKPKKALKKPVTLAEIKADDLLKNMMMVRQGRLSVTALTKEEFDHILMLSQNN